MSENINKSLKTHNKSETMSVYENRINENSRQMREIQVVNMDPHRKIRLMDQKVAY